LISRAVMLGLLGAFITATLSNQPGPIRQRTNPAPPIRVHVVYCVVMGDGQPHTVNADRFGHIKLGPCPFDGFAAFSHR